MGSEMCIRDRDRRALVRVREFPPGAAAVGRAVHAAGGADPDRACLLYTSDAADQRSYVDLGGRRII